MSGKETVARISPKPLLTVVFAWLLTAFVLLLVFSLAISRLATSSRSMGYCASALSFLSACAAGAAAARERKLPPVLAGLLTGLVIALLLLGVGAALHHGHLPSDGLISLLSFTVSGALFGSVFLGPWQKKGRGKRSFSFAQSRKKKS